MNTQPITDFIIARHNVYLARDAGLPSPWTPDKILQKYRFCNVYRELDRVTRYIRSRYKGDSPELWFDLVVARLLNSPESLDRLPRFSDVGWRPSKFLLPLHAIAKAGYRVFNPAYIVSTNGRSMNKLDYLAEYVLQPMWERRGDMDHDWPSLQQFHLKLTTFQGMGSFMAAQVVADLKNTPGQHLEKAQDWYSWAAMGPGSQRGLSRVVHGTVGKRFKQDEFLRQLIALKLAVNKALPKGWTDLCAQDVQNCLCEFDKYERVRLGEGVPKQLFQPYSV